MRKETIQFHLKNFKAYVILASALRLNGVSSWVYYLNKAKICLEQAKEAEIEYEQDKTKTIELKIAA